MDPRALWSIYSVEDEVLWRWTTHTISFPFWVSDCQTGSGWRKDHHHHPHLSHPLLSPTECYSRVANRHHRQANKRSRIYKIPLPASLRPSQHWLIPLVSGALDDNAPLLIPLSRLQMACSSWPGLAVHRCKHISNSRNRFIWVNYSYLGHSVFPLFT